MALTTRPSQPSDGRTAGHHARDHRAAAAPHALQRRKRHQQRMGAGKSHHLARNGAAAAGLDRHPGADRHGVDRPGHLNHEAAHADHPAVDLDSVEFRDLFSEGFHYPS